MKFSKMKFTQNLSKTKLNQSIQNKPENIYEVQSVGKTAHITKAPKIARKYDRSLISEGTCQYLMQ